MCTQFPHDLNLDPVRLFIFHQNHSRLRIFASHGAVATSHHIRSYFLHFFVFFSCVHAVLLFRVIRARLHKRKISREFMIRQWLAAKFLFYTRIDPSLFGLASVQTRNNGHGAVKMFIDLCIYSRDVSAIWMHTEKKNGPILDSIRFRIITMHRNRVEPSWISMGNRFNLSLALCDVRGGACAFLKLMIVRSRMRHSRYMVVVLSDS